MSNLASHVRSVLNRVWATWNYVCEPTYLAGSCMTHLLPDHPALACCCRSTARRCTKIFRDLSTRGSLASCLSKAAEVMVLPSAQQSKGSRDDLTPWSTAGTSTMGISMPRERLGPAVQNAWRICCFSWQGIMMLDRLVSAVIPNELRRIYFGSSSRSGWSAQIS